MRKHLPVNSIRSSSPSSPSNSLTSVCFRNTDGVLCACDWDENSGNGMVLFPPAGCVVAVPFSVPPIASLDRHWSGGTDIFFTGFIDGRASECRRCSHIRPPNMISAANSLVVRPVFAIFQFEFSVSFPFETIFWKKKFTI